MRGWFVCSARNPPRRKGTFCREQDYVRPCMRLDPATATLYWARHLRGPQMSDVSDNLIDRQSPPNDPARIAAVIASDQRFAYFGTSLFTERLLRLDQKIGSGVPMSLKRVANILNTD